MPVKIAFGGKMRVGKDTAVKYCKSQVDSYDHFSFAEPVYETDWGRAIDENIWINVLLEKGNKSTKDYIFVSDIRFENEFEALKQDGWICVKIVKKTKLVDSHISENNLDTIEDYKWDYIVTNNSNINNFYNKIKTILDNAK
jgi:hypothetical protein